MNNKAFSEYVMVLEATTVIWRHPNQGGLEVVSKGLKYTSIGQKIGLFRMTLKPTATWVF